MIKDTGDGSDEVIHIGDSISSDVKGASALGIRTLWLNRSDKPVPEGVTEIKDLISDYLVLNTWKDMFRYASLWLLYLF